MPESAQRIVLHLPILPRTCFAILGFGLIFTFLFLIIFPHGLSSQFPSDLTQSRLWISALPTAFNGLRVAWKSARPWNCGTLEPATAQCRSWNLQAEGWLLGWMVGKCWSAIVEKWWMWKIITTDSPTTAPLFGSLLWTADWFKYRAPKRWQNRSTLAPTMLSKCQFYLRLWACARSGLESRRRMANRFSLFQKNM